MPTKKSGLLIRDYNNIRRILRDIYIFGFFNRDDFVGMGISGRKYDNEQRRISAYLPQGFIRKRRVGGKVQYYCHYGMSTGDRDFLAVNHLAETYRNKSFTMLDIASYFFVLSILNEEEGLTLPEILDEIPQVNDEIIFTKDNLRVKLGELEERGLIYSEKHNRNIRYYLANDLWKIFTEDELKDIYLYLDFIKNIMPLEMPYALLQRKLKMYLQAVKMTETDSDSIAITEGADDLPESIFQFKHNHLFNVLDNEVLLTSLRAIRSRRSVTVKRTSGVGMQDVIPVSVIHECTYGRQYLLCVPMDTKDNRIGDGSAIMIRLDRIDNVIQGDELADDVIRKAVIAAAEAEDCWCTSGLGEMLHKVVIEVNVKGDRKSYMLQRIRREGHGGVLTEQSDGSFRFETEVRDPLEMVPWIRSFGEHMKVIEDSGTGLSDAVRNDWEKAARQYKALYGLVEREDHEII